MKAGHLPVLAEEVMTMLAPAPGSLQIDATLGGGGHTERILEATDPDGRLLGLDADGAAIARVRARLGAPVRRPARPPPGELPRARDGRARGRLRRVDGLLFDLGLSSFQLADRERGFGFRAGGPLDMRFDTSRGVPAAELLATLDADELAALFRRYGEEPKAGRIARAIVDARRTAPIATAEELAALVERRRPGPTRAAAPDPSRRPGSSRRCASPSTRSSTRSRRRWPRRWTCCGPAAASSSSATTRSRTGSSNASSPPNGGAASARPRCPICVCGRNPRLRPLGPSR